MTEEIADTLERMTKRMQEALREDAKETAKLPEGSRPLSDEGAEWDPHQDDHFVGDD